MRTAAMIVAASVWACGVARAEPGPPGALPHVTSPMQVIDGSICNELRADKHEACKRIAKLAGASVFWAGTKVGIRRVVLAIEQDGGHLIAPGADFLGEDCASGTCVTLTGLHPTMRAIAIDGRPAVLLELTAQFRDKSSHAAWQTESLTGCGTSAAGAWKCTTVDVDRCAANVSDDGAVTTSCGGHTTLTLH